MPGCAVATCQNYYSNTKGKKIHFHLFPKKNPELQTIWLLKCRRRDPVNIQNARVCSDHFTPDDYKRDLMADLMGIPPKMRLKEEAIPSVNLPGGCLKQEAKTSDDLPREYLMQEAITPDDLPNEYLKQEAIIQSQIIQSLSRECLRQEAITSVDLPGGLFLSVTDSADFQPAAQQSFSTDGKADGCRKRAPDNIAHLSPKINKTGKTVSTDTTNTEFKKMQKRIQHALHNARVCSDHFKPDDYKQDLMADLMGIPPKMHLKEGAIPLVNLPGGCLKQEAKTSDDLPREYLKHEADGYGKRAPDNIAHLSPKINKTGKTVSTDTTDTEFKKMQKRIRQLEMKNAKLKSECDKLKSRNRCLTKAVSEVQRCLKQKTAHKNIKIVAKVEKILSPLLI